MPGLKYDHVNKRGPRTSVGTMMTGIWSCVCVRLIDVQFIKFSCVGKLENEDMFRIKKAISLHWTNCDKAWIKHGCMNYFIVFLCVNINHELSIIMNELSITYDGHERSFIWNIPVISYEIPYESIHREIVMWYFIWNFERNFTWNVVRNYSLNSMNKVSCGTSYGISYNAMKFYS